MSNEKAILTLLQGCNSLNKLRKIHAHVILSGLRHHAAIGNKLLNFCAISVSGSLPYARLLFRHMDCPQTEAWNSIIRGFAQSASPIEAVVYYNQMVWASLSPPDTFTFSFVLKACERLKAERKCREVHGSVIRWGYDGDVIICTNLMKCYAAMGFICVAQQVFDKMPTRDLVAWNAMISCYSQQGLHQEALETYNQMRSGNVDVDGFTLVGLLSSCAHLGALNIGVQMHRFAREKGLVESLYVGNALIDMYAKCGSLDQAILIFDRMQRKDVFTWNSMIVGYGVHGRGTEAIFCFQQMLEARIQPSSVTFLGLLCGCSHQGLVQEGVKFFNLMSSKFRLRPEVKHYGCLVDLYGRAGKLEKALEIILNSSQNDPVLWRILLGSCKIHKNVGIGEIAMNNLSQLGATNAGDCILLATIYAGVKNTSGVVRMRKMIRSQGIKTTPGWSWIEIGEQVHKFVVDDKSHRYYIEVYEKLKEVIHQASLFGYIGDGYFSTTDVFSTSEILETSCSYHSEKLAIAFGLARTADGTQIRIVKNLRVCRDCHSFVKAVSLAFNREIIVRDRVRFHHFKGGQCSCNDYW
ncbi:pentatricopeptide repeat-containing protein At3g56550 [Momordica charantia]|uniref:Pentatricopeptide repeat-containing protein At3g56550 n=1 Tax=Momordica charantia TaxID=3673 RepID=A0A6J1D832_MOMCH|nr:pentatricopeptide repeat-containing protein At3g56550 [Momordica charantia]XP_022149933.1 pentatricopeptide repeat-containing protein At3g56550 [Momordica charantia]XP_022149934.1 pentatricopeptide repeat-containing protein At3g56550 [Momordica charantia]XP_022149935.1 pentatricopeptide repeat-containing protein At3g56550 [Momordica charantia]